MRTYHEVEDADRSDLAGQIGAQRERVVGNLASVSAVVAVMSGKGGVGKSFVTAGLAEALALGGRSVGVLDADLQGPTTARMLRAASGPLAFLEGRVVPREGACGVRVISSDMLLAEGAPLRWREPSSEGFVWRGALEAGMLREFLSDVAWGVLDVLIVDLPPGTERLDVLRQLVPTLAGIVVVTIPSDASYQSVRRGVEVARGAGVAILGVVENMSGYRCGSCEELRPLFIGDAGDRLARDAQAPLLARVPFDERAQATSGRSAAAELLREAAEALAPRLRRP